MKLWYSFTKELKLSSKSWYFYIEIGMAIVFLVILLFVVPENFNDKSGEYIYMDLPDTYVEYMFDQTRNEDLDHQEQIVELEINDRTVTATLFITSDKEIYYLDDKQAVFDFADIEKKFAADMYLNDKGEIAYTYYLQGYEADRLKNLYLVFHNKVASLGDIKTHVEAQEVRVMHEGFKDMSDRESFIPVFLTFNGSLMGLFIIAAYIFLDKQEGIIKAYAVTASTVWQYLLSKVGVLSVTTLITSLIMVIPIIGFDINYGLLILFLITSGLFASSLGLVLTSYFKDFMQSFGALFIVIIFFMLPNIAYFIPSWDPVWMKFIPSYYMIQSFKEIILPSTDVNFVLMSSLGLFIAGSVLFTFANYRFKKTLTI
ncbi:MULTISPECIES: ABC transporter permease [unclassified Fusibacter]|uniref:ABC transporter permease n=1 Tax=unclassified Fusibacter TaxID=2624464 RepID=UPI0010133962|nr:MULTISPECIES: ABC transporter permease [unclassified Fusibacter]MCK8061575.1 ABC transporter permease [Fusibacter sp. A2]NPE23697.1 ABC transporter permease [Fusibacter sp. A1]RXV58725.1 ABC transporter permease [Fusibacter sp. A1]